jgi:ring-1,2-phenylacetyl-CoA epoxidase subunit PaaB
MIEDYEVFVQRRVEEPATHVGSIRAATAPLALQAAKEIFTRRDRCHRVMVVPRGAILATSDEDADLFALAYDKEYRRPEYFTRKQVTGRHNMPETNGTAMESTP